MSEIMKKAKILSGVLLLCFSSPLILRLRHWTYVVDIVVEATPMDSTQSQWGMAKWMVGKHGKYTWNTIHDNKKENAALNDVQVKLITRLNLMINGRCAREC